MAHGGGGTVEHSRFTTAGLAPRDQLPTYCDQLTVVTVPVSRSGRPAGFRAAIDRYRADDTMYIEARTDAYAQTRSIAQISVDKMQSYCFHVLADGGAETSTGAYPRRSVHQSRPGILALDMSQPMSMSRHASQVRALFLPRAVVESVLPQAQALHGRVLEFDATSPAKPSMANAIADALDRLRRLDAMSAADARQRLVDSGQLIAAAFAQRYRLSGNIEAAEKAASFGQARRYIEAHLYDPDLTPDSVRHLVHRSDGNAAYVGLVRTGLPYGGGAIGIVLLVTGLGLMVSARNPAHRGSGQPARTSGGEHPTAEPA